MSHGVIYHHRGTKCMIRLCVSIYSLRRHYSGPVTVLQEGPLPDWVRDFLESLGVAVQDIGEPQEPVLIRKTQLWQLMPYDRAMYLDADTLVLSPVDDFLQLLEMSPVVASWFTGWLTQGRKMTKRIREWTPVATGLVPAALEYGKAVNGGVMGWSRNSSLLREWESLTRRGLAAGCNRLVIDEVACQLLLPQHPHAIAHHEWNTSGLYGRPEGAKILHFHGRKHVRDSAACQLWKKAYWELREHAIWGRHVADPAGDRRLKRYLGKENRPHSDMTIVSACDGEYARQLARNLPLWMKTPGLMEHAYLIFLVNLKRSDPRVAFLGQYSNVRLIEWSWPTGAREASFSAFVFGVAEHVRSSYWMKLDADVRPIAGRFEWPQYTDVAITAHKWGYTRVKKDDGATEHWLNKLDEWWGGEPIFPPALPLKEKYWHQETPNCAGQQTEDQRMFRASQSSRP